MTTPQQNTKQRTQSVQAIQERRGALITQWTAWSGGERATAHPILAARAQGRGARTVAPAVYKIKPLFKATKGRTTRRAASNRIKVSGRLVCAAGAAGPAPAVRSNARQIKGAAARSASVIIIMQALRGARDSGERSTRVARAPRGLPPRRPPPATPTCQRAGKQPWDTPCQLITSQTSSVTFTGIVDLFPFCYSCYLQIFNSKFKNFSFNLSPLQRTFMNYLKRVNNGNVLTI